MFVSRSLGQSAKSQLAIGRDQLHLPGQQQPIRVCGWTRATKCNPQIADARRAPATHEANLWCSVAPRKFGYGPEARTNKDVFNDIFNQYFVLTGIASPKGHIQDVSDGSGSR